MALAVDDSERRRRLLRWMTASGGGGETLGSSPSLSTACVRSVSDKGETMAPVGIRPRETSFLVEVREGSLRPVTRKNA